MKEVKEKKHQNNTKDTREERKPSDRKERREFKTKKKLGMLRDKKSQVEKKLSVAQSATASMGRFDKKAHKEQRKLKVKRRKEYRHFNTAQEEVERNKQMLTLVLKSQGAKKLGHSL